MRFAEKVCIVTGGGSGIGRATCQRFAAEGGRVVVADLDPGKGNETVGLITSGGGQAAFARCDVSSSVHAHESEPGVAPYAASKGGMEAFMRVLALELEAKKIRVNCVAPGAANAPMLWNNPKVKDGDEKISGAVGQPEDLAAAICFLASADARFVNGTTLAVDGARLDIL